MNKELTLDEETEELERDTWSLSFISTPHPSLSADSWPDTLLDSAAREALDWTPQYDLPNMVGIMIRDIGGIVENEKKQNLT